MIFNLEIEISVKVDYDIFVLNKLSIYTIGQFYKNECFSYKSKLHPFVGVNRNIKV